MPVAEKTTVLPLTDIVGLALIIVQQLLQQLITDRGQYRQFVAIQRFWKDGVAVFKIVIHVLLSGFSTFVSR